MKSKDMRTTFCDKPMAAFRRPCNLRDDLVKSRFKQYTYNIHMYMCMYIYRILYTSMCECLLLLRYFVFFLMLVQ